MSLDTRSKQQLSGSILDLRRPPAMALWPELSLLTATPGDAGHVGHASQTWLIFLPFWNTRSIVFLFVLSRVESYEITIVVKLFLSWGLHRVAVFSMLDTFCRYWCFLFWCLLMLFWFVCKKFRSGYHSLGCRCWTASNTDCFALQILNMFKIWWHVEDVCNYVAIV